MEGLKEIAVKSDDQVAKDLKTKIGKIFISERKEKQLMKRWVEEIAGEDEEFEPIIKSLSKHAGLMPFERFKKMCGDDKEREAFVQRCKSPGKDLPDLDDE